MNSSLYNSSENHNLMTGKKKKSAFNSTEGCFIKLLNLFKLMFGHGGKFYTAPLIRISNSHCETELESRKRQKLYNFLLLNTITLYQ